MDHSYHGGAAAGGSAGFSGQILWDWQTGEHCEPRDGGHADATKFLWDCLNQDDDELLELHGNRTPLRDCFDFFADLGDITCKEALDPEESRESKRRRTLEYSSTLDLEESRESKRRRTLEYPSESSQSEVGSHETGSPFVTSEVAEVSLLCIDEPESLNCDMQYTSNSLDTINSVSNEAPYKQEDNHLEHCSYGTPVYIEPDIVPCSQESIAYIDDQAGISGTSKIAPMTERLIRQETRKLSTLKVSKGASAVKVKQNITTSVAYPFTVIKPWEEGEVTLQDINQRIHAPPKKAPEILGTSAFSGKPVIGKTRIRTEGGRGSITILRTKG